MAIDKTKTKQLLEAIDAVTATLPIPETISSVIKNQVMGQALEELRRLVNDARPPVFFLVGRTGHGKSSLINALARQDVATVSPKPEPCNVETVRHHVRFPEEHAEWTMYDSRGIFEVKRPDGAADENAVEVLKKDILKYKPDVILHVLSIKEVRSAGEDLAVMRDLQALIKGQQGTETPVLAVLTHADNLGDVAEWPPEQYAEKQSIIADHVRGMAEHAAAAGDGYKCIGELPLYRGCEIDKHDNRFLYVVPVNVPMKVKNRWNLDTLVEIISGQLPAGARLQFFQALHRKEMLRQMSSDLIRRFALIAGGIGATPIPIADIAVLTPLQLLLIAIIGGLSCRDLSMATATEYAAASGVTIGGAFALRQVFRQIIKLFGPVGDAVSGMMAATGTYALGKSAEAYFFGGEVRKPEEFAKEYETWTSP